MQPHISQHSVPKEEKDWVKDLGVLMSNDGSFYHHIQTMAVQTVPVDPEDIPYKRPQPPPTALEVYSPILARLLLWNQHNTSTRGSLMQSQLEDKRVFWDGLLEKAEVL